jgi:hypothetical protein
LPLAYFAILWKLAPQQEKIQMNFWIFWPKKKKIAKGKRSRCAAEFYGFYVYIERRNGSAKSLGN